MAMTGCPWNLPNDKCKGNGVLENCKWLEVDNNGTKVCYYSPVEKIRTKSDTY
jgi:hypothetical protein